MEDALPAHVAAKEEDLGKVLERSNGAVQLQARARMLSRATGTRSFGTSSVGIMVVPQIPPVWPALSRARVS